MKDGNFITLGIESSCDDTSIALLSGGRDVLFMCTASQTDIFQNYGGVVPEISSRKHLENINNCIDTALKNADITFDNVDLIAVTKGPGLVGSLLVGMATAKAISLATGIPIIGVNHMMGHITACLIDNKDLEPPYMGLIVSGGHTEIVNVNSYTDIEYLGGTRDDAAGEAYDKVARVLGLSYPGGPKIDKLAKEGNKDAIYFKRVYLDKDSFDFSFSGIKTAVLNYMNSERQAGNEPDPKDVAAGFQEAILEVLVNKAMHALEVKGEKRLAVGGGVTCNSRLRELLTKECEKHGVELYLPSPKYCQDNGAMIASFGYHLFMARGQKGDDLFLEVDPALDI